MLAYAADFSFFDHYSSFIFVTDFTPITKNVVVGLAA